MSAANLHDTVRSYIESLSEHRPSDVEEAVALTALGKLAAKEEVLRAILSVPSRRTLLLNAEARAMYELALRATPRSDRRPELRPERRR